MGESERQREITLTALEEKYKKCKETLELEVNRLKDAMSKLEKECSNLKIVVENFLSQNHQLTGELDVTLCDNLKLQKQWWI